MRYIRTAQISAFCLCQTVNIYAKFWLLALRARAWAQKTRRRAIARRQNKTHSIV